LLLFCCFFLRSLWFVVAMEEKKMQYVRLGNSGLKVSRICLGMMSYGDPTWRAWVLPKEDAVPFVKRALELGINFFDTADVYSLGQSEQALGNALVELKVKRDEVVIATKVFSPTGNHPNGRGLSRKHIFDSIDQSLKNLRVDYVDLYQIHRWDNDTPVEETMEALNDLVRSGKVRYIGASSMWAWQFAKAQSVAEKHGWTKFVSMQNHYNLLYREEEREMNPLCKDQGVGLIPWSPLARGVLVGNRTRENFKGDTARGQADEFTVRLYEKTFSADLEIVERVAELAKKKNVSAASIALAWLLHKGVSSPIIGATKQHHLDDAVAAVHVKLTDEEVTYLEQLYQPHSIAGHQ